MWHTILFHKDLLLTYTFFFSFCHIYLFLILQTQALGSDKLIYRTSEIPHPLKKSRFPPSFFSHVSLWQDRVSILPGPHGLSEAGMDLNPKVPDFFLGFLPIYYAAHLYKKYEAYAFHKLYALPIGFRGKKTLTIAFLLCGSPWALLLYFLGGMITHFLKLKWSWAGKVAGLQF